MDRDHVEDGLGGDGSTEAQRPIRAYWLWLQSHEHVSPDRNLFYGRKVNRRQTMLERATAERARSEPDELVRLWQKVAVNGDAMLAAAVNLGVVVRVLARSSGHSPDGRLRED